MYPHCRPPRAVTANTMSIDGVKWHVTSFNLADYVLVEAGAVRWGARRRPRAAGRRPSLARRGKRAPSDSHNIADEHPIVAFNEVRVPVTHLVGERRRRR